MKKANRLTFYGSALLLVPLACAAAPQVYEVSIIGPGGHSFGSYGQTNAVHAAARVVMELEREVPSAVASDIKGGVSVNAIAADAKMKIFAQTEDAQKVKLAVEKGCAAENAFRGVKPGDKTSGGAAAEIRCTVTP